MKFNILTLFPEVFSVFFESSILGKAVEKGIVSYNCVNFRDYSTDKHNRVDDYTFGGGKGMLISPDSIYKAYDDIVLMSGKRPKMIYMSPRGKVLNQEIACDLAKEEELIILCGHYEGVDKRVIDELCDYELSVGDYVLTGGEMPAMILCDCISRIIPGVLSSEDSFTGESHYNNGPLEYDQYTRPSVYNGIQVPEVLLSGNQKEIDLWRENNSKDITLKNRPDIYKNIYGNLPDDKEELTHINLLLLGATPLICGEIMLQLNKNNIICDNLYDENNISTLNCDSLVILVCGDYKVSVNKNLNESVLKNSLILNLRPFTSKRITSCLDFISETFYKPLKRFVTYTEFISEINRFVCRNKSNENPVLSDIKLVCAVPYDIYETYSQKLKKFNPDNVFVIESSNKKIQGNYFLELNREKIPVEIFSFKSKIYGMIQVMYIENFDIQKICKVENGNYKVFL